MTVPPSIDPTRMLEEHLAQASLDLLRELMQTFVKTLLSAEVDAGYARARTPSLIAAPTGRTETRAGQPS